MRTIIIALLSLSLFSGAVAETPEGQFFGAKPVDLPPWFKTSFLDFAEDIEEANDENRQVMIYFHQDGCPYCAKLVEENFHNPPLVEKIQRNFDVIEINIWGDRELTDWEGRELREKTFAALMRVQFTPTLIFLSSNGEVVLRVNGYQSSEKMHRMLDYVAAEKYREMTFGAYLDALKQNRTGTLNRQNFFDTDKPHLLMRSESLPAAQYLAVFFEEPNCPSCDAMHRLVENSEALKNHFQTMQVVQLNALTDEKIITPDGRRTTARDWYQSLGLTDKPAIVFFDKNGDEIIRKDALLKIFHFESVVDYVTTGGFKHQPNFQRYIEEKADGLRARGIDVDIWR